jgi:hypothetical protein
MHLQLPAAIHERVYQLHWIAMDPTSGRMSCCKGSAHDTATLWPQQQSGTVQSTVVVTLTGSKRPAGQQPCPHHQHCMPATPDAAHTSCQYASGNTAAFRRSAPCLVALGRLCTCCSCCLLATERVTILLAHGTDPWAPAAAAVAELLTLPPLSRSGGVTGAATVEATSSSPEAAATTFVSLPRVRDRLLPPASVPAAAAAAAWLITAVGTVAVSGVCAAPAAAACACGTWLRLRPLLAPGTAWGAASATRHM